MFHTSTIELSQTALRKNIEFLKNTIGPDTMLSSVVKGNAYGHGIESMVPMLENTGIRHFSVFSAQEAFRVHACAQKNPVILIMGMVDNEQLDWAIKNDIEYFVFTQERLRASIAIAKNLGKKAKVHIELETGMNRTGFDAEQIDLVINSLKSAKEFIDFKGLCTHYAGAESIGNYVRIQKQIKRFNELKDYFAAQGLVPELYHTACSAACMAYPETRMDMVRIGIMTYGLWPSQEILMQYMQDHESFTKDPLQRVVTWKSRIMSIKQVKAGEFIGYGTSYQATKNMTIGTVPVGYAYGYSRNLSNLGRVLVQGKRASVIGVVNMNLMLINLCDVKNPQQGDEVVLIGKQKKNAITVASFSDYSNQPNYELLTRLPTDIPRVIKKNG